MVGMSVARVLALDGLRVTLLERGVCGAEASWACAGMLSPCHPYDNDPVAHLQHRTIERYPDFCRALMEESGVDSEYEPCGEIQLAFDDHDFQAFQTKQNGAGACPLPDGSPVYTLCNPEAVARLEPAVSSQVVGGLECRTAAQVRSPRLLRALRIACERAGVEVREHTAVHDITVEGRRVTGVQTKAGRLNARWVILCAGAWSSGIGERLGTLMPVHPVRGQMILMKLDVPPFRHILSAGRTYLVPRRDGRVLLGATEEPEAGFVKRTTPRGLAGLTEKALQMVPRLADVPIEMTWSGLRPGTPDGAPFIGPVPGFEGLLAATGHYRKGLAMAPLTAEAIGCFVRGRAFDLDLSMCAPGRPFDM